MSAFFFFYTMALILACMLAASVSLCAYFVSRRQVYLAWFSSFIAYLSECGLVFFEEYSSFKPTEYAALDAFPFFHPWAKLLLSAVLIVAVWWYLLDQLGAIDRKHLMLLPACVILAQATLIVSPLNDLIRQETFFVVRDSYLLVCILMPVLAGTFSNDEALRQRLRSRRTPLAILIALVVATLVVDLNGYLPYSQTFWSAFFSEDSEFWFFILGRNVFENATSVLFAVFAMAHCSAILRLRFSQPEAVDYAEGSNELHLARFAQRHELTPREQDILVRVVNGDSNQQIATDLVLSLGTVKAHVSHIYTKTKANGRTELLQRFWSES